MNATCSHVEYCVSHSEPSESLAVTAARLADSLEQDVRDFLVASDQNLGDIEVQIEQQSRELLRLAAEKAAQKKADLTPPVCPVCQQRLRRVTAQHRRSFECKFGTLTLGRSRGYCKRCRKWRFPADTVLGLEETAGYSPRVQEMSALLASKMPVEEASAVLEHLTGVRMPRSTLDREAKRQGQRARELRRKLDEQAGAGPKSVQSEMVLEPYQMIVQLDALEHPRAAGLGPDAGVAPQRAGTGAVALGLHRHLFSIGSPWPKRRGAAHDQPARIRRHARRDRWSARAIAWGGHEARLGPGGGGSGHWRRGGLDLAPGR